MESNETLKGTFYLNFTEDAMGSESNTKLYKAFIKRVRQEMEDTYPNCVIKINTSSIAPDRFYSDSLEEEEEQEILDAVISMIADIFLGSKQ